MPQSNFLTALNDRVLLCDGAMGTQLYAAGLKPGACGELWNVDEPEKIEAIQRRYVDAGVDCLITNTFGATSTALKKHGLDARVVELNAAGARLARKALGETGYVLGDIGPCGEMLEPLGTMTEDDMQAVFAEAATGLIQGGADAIIIETMMAIEELLVAVRAVRSVDADIAIIGSMAYNQLKDGGYATMMGVRPEQQATMLLDAGANVIACNCGTEISAPEHAEIVAAFKAAATDAPIMTQPNAGNPEQQGKCLIYHETPEKMASRVTALIEAGARVVGGCCGTTPEHIAAFRDVIDKANQQM